MKRNIYIMYAISLLQGMVFYTPVATLYRTAQGVSVFQITVIESISLILCILLEIPWGMVADRIGYRKTMLFCCSLFLASKVIFWQASGFGGFLLERILLSIVISGLSGVDTSILYLSCKEGESQKIFGIYNSLGTVGLLIAAAVYSLFIGENFKLAGALTVISYGFAVLAALGLKEVKEVKKEEAYKFSLHESKQILQQTIADKRLLVFLLGVSVLSETHQVITVFLNQVQYEKCGLSAPAMGYVYIVVTLAGLCGVWSAWFTKKCGRSRMGILLYVLSGVACLTLAFTGNGVLSVGSVLMLQIARSIFGPFQLELQNKQISTERRATALSINAMFIDSVGAGINIIFGFLAGISLGTAFLFGAGLCFAGLCLFWRYCDCKK